MRTSPKAARAGGHEMIRGLFVASTVSLAVYLGSSVDAQSPADRTQLAALWNLNADLSDKPAQNLERGEGEGRNRSGRGGDMGRGGGMRGGSMGGNRPDPEEMKARLAARQGMLRTFREATDRFTLIFRETDGAIVITNADGRIITLMADGKKYKEPLPDGGTADRVTKWKEGALVTELKSSDLKLTQTFALLEEGKRVVITSALEGSRTDRAPALRRVYDRAG
jgi:hypothetical protein